MKYVSVAEVKNRFSRYLAQTRKKKEAIIVTHHGKPYALIHPISEQDLEELGRNQLGQSRLRQANGRGSCALFLPRLPEIQRGSRLSA